MNLPTFSNAACLERLQSSTDKIGMVLDTDAYNEVDDQFAVVYALLSRDRLDVEGIYASPFYNKRSIGPADGMEKSYQEILNLLNKMDMSSDGLVFRGSTNYLKDVNQPQKSEATIDLIDRAMKRNSPPLYVVAIGAITNVASAILIKPEIASHIVVVWLGGNPFYWPNNQGAFNLVQDPNSYRLIFDSGVPLVHIPCFGVTSHLLTTLPKIERYVAGQGAIGDYLAKIFREYTTEHFAYSKVIWDISAIAYLINHLLGENRVCAQPNID